jgi:hypothetical protein
MERKLTIKNISIVLIPFLACFLFYWYEIKPSQIVKSCQIESIIEAKNDPTPSREDTAYFYKKCMRENGIDK